MNRSFVIAASLLTVAGCARQAVVASPPAAQPPVSSPVSPPSRLDVRAIASINDVANTTIGSASFSDTPAGLLVTINVTGLGIGPHGVHLHSVGSCVAPTFTSAGDHFNPSNKRHGFRNDDGHHAGDMPNLISPPAGAYRVQFVLDGVRLTGRGGLMDNDGASIVIHGAEDDLLTHPSGNSGGRLACGVIRLTTP
jgi:Cu-Zn family superoxide dismutase